MRFSGAAVARVQQAVGFFAQGLAQKLFIQRLEFRVFMGLAHGQSAVNFVQAIHAPDFGLAVAVGLAATAHAAAGTGHDLHKMRVARA